jgi:hypothetical protein
MAQHYSCDPIDLSSYVPHLQDWTGLAGGFDAEGLFVWSRYNPRARWDWWEIGGRWHGVVQGHEVIEQQANLDAGGPLDRTGHLAHNMVQVMDLDPGTDFFAILTPDGEWYERGRMGWFGFVQDEKPQRDWEAIRSEILSAYPRCYIVGIDCHI